MEKTETQAMIGVSLSDSLRDLRRLVPAHPVLTIVVALAVIVLLTIDLAAVIPFYAPLAASPFFPFVSRIHDLLALGVALYAAYRGLPALGLAAMFLFLAVRVFYFALELPQGLPEIFRSVFIAFIGVLGIRLILELRWATELAQQRQREIAASAELSARVLNERILFLEEAARREERLARLYQLIALASRTQAPLDMAREFLGAVSEEVGAEYASLGLIRADGSLGERADSFRGLQPFSVSARPGGLAEEIIRTGQSQYVSDATTDPRANPALLRAGIRSYLGLPLKAKGQLVGILFLHSTQAHAFQEERQFLESMAQVLALPLLRAELFGLVERGKREWVTTFDAIGDGVVVMDEDRRIIRANQAFARMVGKRPQELVGKKVCSLVHGGEEPIPGCPLERALALNKSQASEWREPHLGDKLLDIRIFPIPTAAGEPRRFVHLFRVIGEAALT